MQEYAPSQEVWRTELRGKSSLRRNAGRKVLHARAPPDTLRILLTGIANGYLEGSRVSTRMVRSRALTPNSACASGLDTAETTEIVYQA